MMDNPRDKRPLFLTYQVVTQGWDWVRDPGFWSPVSGLLMVQEGTSAPAPESTFQPTGRRRGVAFKGTKVHAPSPVGCNVAAEEAGECSLYSG